MNHRRGFSLVELLITISLLGVFSLLASRLLWANIHIAAATLAADGNSVRFDGAIRTLREDVFQSTAIEMPEPMLLRIHGPGNQIIDWRNDHDSLLRSAGNYKHDWKLGRSISIKLDGAIVLVTANPGDSIAMASIHPGGGR